MNKNMPFIPETNQQCVTCGICAKHFPTSAINFSDCMTIDVSKCIKCNSCFNRCSLNAKATTSEPYKNMLITNFASQEKNPEIFLA
jgi:uncharacterized Fe-S center protein